MKLRILPVLLCIILAACSHSAAGGELYPEEPQASEIAQHEETDMTSLSLYRLGNTYRINKAISKARSGEKTVIAYLGGSITEGVGGGKDTCYARLSFDSFNKNYCSGNAEYVNAGLSGTPSELGMLRVQRDVLTYDPDIVFIEFAVNDSTDTLAQQSYESLVRTVLNHKSEPAVILITNRLENGYSAGEHMKAIGEHYDLTVISPADAITPEFESGNIKWSDYSDDQSHPNAFGHKLIAGFITYMFCQAESTPSDGYTVPPNDLYGAVYKDAVMITPDSPVSDMISITDNGSFEPVQLGAAGFPTSWKSGDGSDPLCAKMHGNSLFVIVKRNKTADMGSFDVYLNGAKVKAVNTMMKDGWGEAFPVQIIKFQTSRDMDIEIVPSENNDGKTIQILGLAAADNGQ